MGSMILGTGAYVPEKVLTNHDLEKMVDTSDEWIRSRTGIEERHIGGPGDYTHIIASKAAKNALDMAGLSPNDLDMIIVATVSSHMCMPSCACYVQAELGAQNAVAFDINAACSGFLYSLDMADKYLKADPSLKILAIGAETLSTKVNWKDRNTCILFGDGAGAAVLGSAGQTGRGIIDSCTASDGNLWRLLYMHTAESLNPDLAVEGREGSHIVMEGREVFKYAVKSMEDAVLTLLKRNDIKTEDIKLLIPHQANVRIIKKLMSRLGLPDEKVIINAPQYGNTSAASIPIALDEANRAGKMQAGDLVAFCSFGGGFTWGASLIKW